jgi:hypothetical protein
MVWQERIAAEQFDDLFLAAINKGPQTVARGGVEVAVLVSIQDWHRATANSNDINSASASQEEH